MKYNMNMLTPILAFRVYQLPFLSVELFLEFHRNTMVVLFAQTEG